MRATPQIITSALQLYFTGESLPNVVKFLKLQGVNINHNTVYRWMKKFVGLMQSYLEKITLNVSDAWRADELYLKVKGTLGFTTTRLGKVKDSWKHVPVTTVYGLVSPRKRIHLAIYEIY
jgi:hypothetical protein